MVTSIAAAAIDVVLDDALVLDGVSLDASAGSFIGVVGPNGCGKTTLLRALHRALPASAGSVLLDGAALVSMDGRRVARAVAVVAQEHPVTFEYTAAEVAAMGRIPHKRGFDIEDDRDRRIVAESLDALGLAHLAHRPFNAMSGGERQRVLIARALVQESQVVLLDEPTNHLDIHFQLDVLHRVRNLGLTTVAALHDLNLAAAWCDQVYVMAHGKVVAAGPPEVALSADLVREVFGVQVTVFTHPLSGKHQLLFDRLATSGDDPSARGAS